MAKFTVINIRENERSHFTDITIEFSGHERGLIHSLLPIKGSRVLDSIQLDEDRVLLRLQGTGNNAARTADQTLEDVRLSMLKKASTANQDLLSLVGQSFD